MTAASWHFSKCLWRIFKVAGNSFQFFSTLGVWWVIITILYRLTPKSWYQQTSKSSGNKLLLILRRRFRATLNFWKFKVALKPLCRSFLNFAKSYILSCWLQFDNKKWGSLSSFLSYKRLKLKLRVSWAGHIVAMVIYCATQLTATCSPWFGSLLIPWFWRQPVKNGYNDLLNSKCWKVLETVTSHLK